MKLAWIVDLDGTLCNDRSRRCAAGPDGKIVEYVPEYSPTLNWDTYFNYELMLADGLHDNLARAIRVAQKTGVHIVYLTGRPEKTRKATEDWLKQHDLDFHAHLVMRDDDDRTPARSFKAKKIDWLINEYNFKFILGVTDRECDIEAYEEHNIPGLYAKAYEDA